MRSRTEQVLIFIFVIFTLSVKGQVESNTTIDNLILFQNHYESTNSIQVKTPDKAIPMYQAAFEYFSEKKDTKSVILLQLENSKLSEPKILQIPAQRAFVKITGNILKLKEKLISFENKFPLPAFIELECLEKNFSALILKEVYDLVSEMNQNSQEFKILKHRVRFEHGGKDTSELFASGIQIEDLSPTEVFLKRIENEPIENKQEILEAFQELLEITAAELNE